MAPYPISFAEDDPDAGSYGPLASSTKPGDAPCTSASPSRVLETDYAIPPMPVQLQAKNGQTLGLFFGYQYYFSNFHPVSFKLDGESHSSVQSI